MAIRGIIFDKDGTLTDFRATWGQATRQVLAGLSGGDAGLEARLAAALDYDPETGAFAADSPSVTGPNAAIVEALLPHLPHLSPAHVALQIDAAGGRVEQVPAVPLEPLMRRLSAAGYALGVVTNDSERGARRHLTAFGVAGLIDYVAGADSGLGIKPDPAPLLRFAAETGLRPAEVVMVGDGVHDLAAGRAAGMATVAVLMGMNAPERLAALADAVLPDIGHLPDWLGLAPE